MRLLRTSPLVLLTNLIVSGIPFLLICLIPELINKLAVLMCAFPLLCLIWGCSPLGQRRLGARQSQQALLAQVGSLFATQLGMFWILLATLGGALSGYRLLASESNLTLQQGFESFLNPTGLTFFLCWMALVVLFAIAECEMLHLRKEKNLFPACLNQLKRGLGEGKLGFAFEIYVACIIAAGLFFIFVIIVEQSVNLFLAQTSFTFEDNAFLLEFFGISLMTWLFRGTYWKEKVNFAVRKQYSMGLNFLIILTMIVVGSALLTFLSHKFFSESQPDMGEIFALISTIKLFPAAVSEQSAYLWLAGALPIACAPMLGSHLAKFARGMTTTAFIGISFLLPVGTVLVIYHWPAQAIEIACLTFGHAWIALITCALVCFAFWRAPHLNRLFFGHSNKGAFDKYRNPKNYLLLLPMTILCGVCIYKLFGFKWFAVMLTMGGLPLSLLIFMTVLGALRLLLVDQNWKKNNEPAESP